MYIQPLFSISEVSELHQVMNSYPLATLIAEGAGEVEINLLPLLLVKAGSLGRLTGHVSKSHNLYSKGRSIKTVTAIFQSPNVYISPRWYVNGQQSGRNAQAGTTWPFKRKAAFDLSMMLCGCASTWMP
ncbi:FMN-binding negative transcriptional regulator [Comamonas testosteroni]|uniref:FMN-binding negative transcriptional regulator n=1 Tax=Comamonas testosteroni TaxID=285 RepID=UPI00076D9763|nr:FMN-binding negative transcriptional regulator [Comamonas testosteroni]KWT64803.1 FMN-binding negative transcriptional regulator [Comamonas testosteroni]